MSRRSVASSTYSHERRKSKHRVTDEDLFKCVFPLLHGRTSCSRPSRAATFSESRKILSIPPASDCPDGNHYKPARYLSYLVLPKPTNLASSTTTNTSNGDTLKEKDREQHSSSRISGAISHSITSIGDVFRDVTAREGSKNVKFPEKLIKVLEQRLENIAMGKDPAYAMNQPPSC